MSALQPALLQINNLCKTFGHFRALDGLTLHIDTGEIYGLIGPNGSGKTTSISILLGILSGDSGANIELFGEPYPRALKKYRNQIGYMPQEITLYEDLSIEKNLRFFGKLYGMKQSHLGKRIQMLLELVELSEFQDRLIKKCSGGMRRRASLACALLHDPEILFLDEPTVGVDPELRMTFWNHFRELAEQGKTILITTHYLAESVKCTRVGFIQKRIIAEGQPQQLQKHVQEAKHLPELPSMEDVFIYFATEQKQGGSS